MIEPELPLRRIVSGGQTGVDRGALNAAFALGLEHGGWCPRGRLAEDGSVPAWYQLDETESPEYHVRTERNVVESEGTLILFRATMSGGTELTQRMAAKHRRPCLAIDLDQPVDGEAIRRWLREHDVSVLNVAGPRESSAAGITGQSQRVLEAVLTCMALE